VGEQGEQHSDVVEFGEAGTVFQPPADSVTVFFHGDLYAWMAELAPRLKDANAPADVAKIGIELLYLARDKAVVLRDGTTERTVELWRT
jgi:hypothetical protein